MSPSVDVVITAYREEPEAVAATVRACLDQSHPPEHVFVVDDGSPERLVLPPSLPPDGVELMRLDRNRGISAARNLALSCSEADCVACVNTEVVPSRNWVEVCLAYLDKHPGVGACCTRIDPVHPGSLTSRWRMRFQEEKVPARPGPVRFAQGHAVLFRRPALASVGGYDERFRAVQEDADVCLRLRDAGWSTHFVTGASCVSLQRDSVGRLARSQVARDGFRLGEPFSLASLVAEESKGLVHRVGRNVAKARVAFLPVDVAIWATAVALGARARLRRWTPPPGG